MNPPLAMLVATDPPARPSDAHEWAHAPPGAYPHTHTYTCTRCWWKRNCITAPGSGPPCTSGQRQQSQPQECPPRPT
eukprot:1151406-Pelagomonas_calceolata.AAC.4